MLERLVADLPPQPGPGGVDLSALRVVDSTLWYVLPRMDWATWRSQYKDQRAVRLHIKYRLADGLPAGGLPSNGVLCERKALRQQLKAGEFYIGDRNYGMNYRYLGGSAFPPGAAFSCACAKTMSRWRRLRNCR